MDDEYAIVLGALGAILLVISMCGLIYWCCCRRKKKKLTCGSFRVDDKSELQSKAERTSKEAVIKNDQCTKSKMIKVVVVDEPVKNIVSHEEVKKTANIDKAETDKHLMKEPTEHPKRVEKEKKWKLKTTKVVLSKTTRITDKLGGVVVGEQSVDTFFDITHKDLGIGQLSLPPLMLSDDIDDEEVKKVATVQSSRTVGLKPLIKKTDIEVVAPSTAEVREKPQPVVKITKEIDDKLKLKKSTGESFVDQQQHQNIASKIMKKSNVDSKIVKKKDVDLKLLPHKATPSKYELNLPKMPDLDSAFDASKTAKAAKTTVGKNLAAKARMTKSPV